jgi:hypothetical protein
MATGTGTLASKGNDATERAMTAPPPLAAIETSRNMFRLTGKPMPCHRVVSLRAERSNPPDHVHRPGIASQALGPDPKVASLFAMTIWPFPARVELLWQHGQAAASIVCLRRSRFVRCRPRLFNCASQQTHRVPPCNCQARLLASGLPPANRACPRHADVRLWLCHGLAHRLDADAAGRQGAGAGCRDLLATVIFRGGDCRVHWRSQR